MASTTAGPISTRTTPMSGVFTPPPSCSSHWTYEGQAANSVTGGLLLQNAWAGQDDTPCYPPGFTGWGRAPAFIQVFSPGACPAGYTAANNNYDGSTTTAVCCLSKFGYTTLISSVNAGGITAQYFGCTSIFTNASPTTVFASDGPGVITSSLDGTTAIFTVVSGFIVMWAQPITVAFQQSDLALFTTSSSSISSSSSTTTSTSSTISSINTVTSTPTTSPAPKKASSLSGGAIAGIVIGALAVLAIIAAAVFFLRRQRKGSPSAENLVPMETHKAQSEYSGARPSDHKHFDPSWISSEQKGPAEMQEDEPVELADLRATRRHELP
ncbi:hypothetical protein KCU92_g6986, partial [Aureobasidium melanogenum]